MKKLIFALFVIAALFVVAMPVAAQGPDAFSRVWYDRTSQMSATWVGDPFGGNPKLSVAVKYEPDGKGGVAAVLQSKQYYDYAGVVGKFGLSPYSPGNILPGGIPSSMSGDGSAPRKAIYIGGAWADASLNPVGNVCWEENTNVPPIFQCRQSMETPYEIPACATVKIPAGSSLWFKLDTWKKDNAGRALNTQIWVDDELDGATKWSGKAAFGAANRYFYGTQSFDGWSLKSYGWGSNQQNPNETNGYFMLIYDPEALAPNYAYAPPNAGLLTGGGTGTSGTCDAAAYAGLPCIKASSGGPATDGSRSISTMFGDQRKIKGGTFDPHQPSHLLFTEGKYDGWVYVRLYNQMIWDGTVSLCSYRELQEPNNNPNVQN